MILSILIPTLADRAHFLNELKENIERQSSSSGKKHLVEVLTDDRDRSVTTGEKRNSLLSRASGEYTWFIDDDDYIHEGAIQKVLDATEKNPDVIGINGSMTTDGKNSVGWEIRLGHPYKAIQRDGKEFYLRFPNHITPMKRIHALTVSFPHKTIFEDYEWAKKLNDSGVLKTQEVIDEQIYLYKVRTKK